MDVYFLGWISWSDISNNIFIPQKITERSVEATIKTLAMKDDLAKVKSDLSEKIGNSIKWMFFFAVANVCSTTVIFWWFLKK